MNWSDCPLVSSDPDVVHGEPVLIGTRVPADIVVESVEAYISEGMSLDQAIDATLESFPGVPEGAGGVRVLLDYVAFHEPQLAL